MKKLMIKATLFVATTCVLVSCSEAEEIDTEFCKCLEATSNMDAKSSKLMGGDISEAEAKEVKELGKIMKEACKDYTTISKEEGLKKKEQCEKQ